MEKSIIQPAMMNLPALNENVTLIFSLSYFHMLHEMVKGSKIRSYGPCKRFSFETGGAPRDAIGGILGAPCAIIILESVVHSGGQHIVSFGSAGWVGKKNQEIGTLISPDLGVDETGICADYNSKKKEISLLPFPGVETCSKIVTVNSFYRLTEKNIKRYRTQEIDLIDMEATPLSCVSKILGVTFTPLFVVSDKVESDYSWNSGFNSPVLKKTVEVGLKKVVEQFYSS